MNLRRIFSDAAQAVRERGLAQNTLCTDVGGWGVGPVCLMGAINVATTGNPHTFIDDVERDSRGFDKTRRIANALIEHMPDLPTPKRGYLALVSWNNDPGRTPNDVIAAFERASAAQPETP